MMRIEDIDLPQDVKNKIYNHVVQHPEVVNYITSLLGPPAVGKSTSLRYLQEKQWPAMDLENFNHEARLEFVNFIYNGTIGAADINPKTYDNPRVFWILLCPSESIYSKRRKLRDELIPSKKDQRIFTINQWRIKYAHLPNVIIFDNSFDVEDLEQLYNFIVNVQRYIDAVVAKQYDFEHIVPVLKQIRSQYDDEGYRETKYPGGSYKDSSPLCFFNNYNLPVFNSPNLANKIVDTLCEKYGEFIQYRETEIKVTEAVRADKNVHKHWNFNLFTVHNRPQDENTIGWYLGPQGVEVNGKKNLNRWVVFTFNCSDMYIFLADLVKQLLNYVQNDEEVAQVLNLFTDWRCTLGFSLSAAYYKKYDTKQSQYEIEAEEYCSTLINEYLYACIDNRVSFLTKLGKELQTRLNESKSMGPGAIANGTRVRKNKYHSVPQFIFESKDYLSNIWEMFTLLPDKLVALNEWRKIDSFFDDIYLHGFDNPDVWISAFLNDMCPENTTAFRVNGNDVALYVKKVDKSSPIWRVETRPFNMQDIPMIQSWCDKLLEYYRKVKQNEDIILDSEQWPILPITTKPREWVNSNSTEGYYCLTFSPYQFRDIFNEEVKRLNLEIKNKTRKGRYFYPCVLLTNKLRQMYPGHWLFNTYMGPIARLYSVALEKGDLGFIRLVKDSKYYHLLQRHLFNYKYVLPGSCDVSHSESTMSSTFIVLRLLGKSKAFKLFFRIACSGFSASKCGLRWHDFAVMSGITFTTFCNMIAGIYKTSLLLSYLAVEEERQQVFETSVRTMLASAYRFLNEELGIDVPSWVNDVDQEYIIHIKTKFGIIDVIHGIGTDDQVWHFMSNEVTVEQMYSLFEMESVKDFCTRFSMNVDLGESTHFGVRLTKAGFTPNFRGSLAKATSFEKKKHGDGMATGTNACIEQNKSMHVKDCIQHALDQVDGGSVDCYSIGANFFLTIIQKAKTYADNILEVYNAPYSPSGKRLSEALEKVGYEPEAAKKIPIEIVADIIEHHYKFLQRFEL